MAKEQFHCAGRNDGGLYYAVTRGDRDTVVEELSQGDIDLAMKIGGKSFLRHAGERGFKEIARLLTIHGACPNEVNGTRQHSLLHFAAASHNYGFASVLLDAHANPSPRNSSDATPLHIAARTGQAYLTRLLIAFNAMVDARDSHGRTPLYWATEKGHLDIAKILLKANSSLDAEDRKGVTPRMVAESLGLELGPS